MEIFKSFTFDSAHFLPHVAEDHKCRRIHGHTYRAVFYIKGQLDPVLGWVEDFGLIKEAIQPAIKALDHHLLNEIPGLENPTCEAIAIWLWRTIKPKLAGLCRIELNETPTSGAIYQGEFE